jgi:hypothetical protein
MVSEAVSLWGCWSLVLLVSGVKGSLELVNVYGVALCVWLVLFVVLLGFGGCDVVVWCQWVVLLSCCSLVLLVYGVKGALELNGLS